MTKKCRRCGKEKPLTEYYTYQRMKDGVRNTCKECHAKFQILRRKGIYIKDLNKLRYVVLCVDKKKTKICSKCGKRKPNNNYYFPHCGYSKSLRPDCKECQRDQQDFRKYGISRNERNILIESQNNKCAISGIKLTLKPSQTNTVNIDHDKKIEKKIGKKESIRGILANNINRGIGLLDHNPFILIASAKYLIEYNKKMRKINSKKEKQ